jgi:cardiolipin synthase
MRQILLIPNLITISRILISPLIIAVFDNFWWLFLIGLYAGISDFFDGFLARLLKQRTALGAILDPLADKFLVLCFLIAAIMHNLLSAWMLIALILRDIYVMLALPILLTISPNQKHGELAARTSGKLTTTLQFLCLAMLALLPLSAWHNTDFLQWRNVPFFLLYPISIFTIIDYTKHYWQNINRPQ